MLVLWALVATGVWAAAFFLVPNLRAFAFVALSVAIAAAVSWPVLGLVCVRATEGRGVWRWFDACLRTLSVGDVFLAIAGILNLLAGDVGATALLVFNVAMLFGSATTMTVMFVQRARGMGVTPGRALALWAVGLQAPFVVVLALWWALA